MANKHPRHGSPNETAPSANDIYNYFNAELRLPEYQLDDDFFQEMQRWLAYELACYRALSPDEETPTVQKSVLKKYIKTLEDAVEFINNSETLPFILSSRVSLEEYKAGITEGTNKALAGELYKKIQIAKNVQSIAASSKSKAGDKNKRMAFVLLKKLSDKIKLVGVFENGDLVLAAKILNDERALGGEHTQYGDSTARVRKITKLSTDPIEIKKQLRKHCPDTEGR